VTRNKNEIPFSSLEENPIPSEKKLNKMNLDDAMDMLKSEL